MQRLRPGGVGLSHPAGEPRGCEACAAARGWRQPAGEARHDGGEDAEQHFVVVERPGEFEATRERSAHPSRHQRGINKDGTLVAQQESRVSK